MPRSLARSLPVRLEAPIADNKWGRLANLADPFGQGLCLIQFIGRGYDEILETVATVRSS